MNRRILAMLVALLGFTASASAQNQTEIGVDVYGLQAGVTNVYYQMPMGRDRALKLAAYSSVGGTGLYGFYKLYFSTGRSKMTPYLELGGGYAADTFAMAANGGLAIPIKAIILEPYFGYVSGGNGSNLGFGFNLAYAF